MSARIIEAPEVYGRLSMDVCIGLMRGALSDLAAGKTVQPVRTIFKLPGDDAFGFMPAWLGEDGFFGAKIITAFHRNLGTQYPSHMGYVMLFESAHGSFVGMADATAITEIRTGAVSGLATALLARKDARVLAVIGAGAQGRSHMAAMTVVRKISEARVYDISTANAERYAAEQAERYGIPVRPCGSVREAVKDADIICTLTPSREPFLEAAWVRPGAHINAVGAFTPVTREVTSELVAASKLYADQVEAMKKECGEYLIPLAEGLIGEDHIRGSIGDLILGRIPGRESDTEITLFDALGLAAEDVVCDRYLCAEA